MIMIMIIMNGAEIIIIIMIGLQFIEFGPRPTYAHNSSFSPPAEIIMMMVIVMIGAEIMIIITSWCSIKAAWRSTKTSLGLVKTISQHLLSSCMLLVKINTNLEPNRLRTLNADATDASYIGSANRRM